MEKTKENKKKTKSKQKEKASIGDIIFRTLIIIAIFFTVVIAYVFYLRGMFYESTVSSDINEKQLKPIIVTK